MARDTTFTMAILAFRVNILVAFIAPKGQCSIDEDKMDFVFVCFHFAVRNVGRTSCTRIHPEKKYLMKARSISIWYQIIVETYLFSAFTLAEYKSALSMAERNIYLAKLYYAFD